MELKYGFKVSLLSDEDGGGYLVEIPDLPGCMTDGDSLEEALQKVESSIDLWIEAAKESGRKVPEPKYYDDSEPSGKFTVRVPKQLHKELINCAEEQGVSLNQLVNYFITKGIHGEIAATQSNDSKNEITYTETKETKITLSDAEFKDEWRRNLSSEDLSNRVDALLSSRNLEKNHMLRRLTV